MLLSVVCETCGGALLGCTSHDDTRALETLLLACHAAHTAPHRLAVQIDGKEPPEGDHDLVVRCLLPECGQRTKEVRCKTPMALVNTHFLSFHTNHEGHAVEAELDGVVIARSPDVPR